MILIAAVAAPLVSADPVPVTPTHPSTLMPSAPVTTAARPTTVRDQLLRLADRLAAVPDDAHPGPYSYVRIWHWARASTVLARFESERWRHPDGSGVIIERRAADRPLLTRRPGGDELKVFDKAEPTRETYTPGRLPPALPEPIPTDTAELIERMGTTAPPEAGPTALLAATANINRSQYLDLHRRAAILRVLATIPTLRYDGEAADITGRPGFSVSLNAGGSTTTLTFDRVTGALLAYEEALNTAPASLFQYELYEHGRQARPAE
ncbi:hypothetical protein E0H26_25345 [Micromonospora zingiberis]|uniref:CU044_5270 family protein n=1 Tax=Micromonospora zingiberis TaxID=2053011 RepID=A0A4V2LV72_9ACTN|nr:hypothetical protein [Micromonospora zingiberis]TCB91615.1 hypothetical protein E0H26_25345 [Micromonospora zingiberis]